MPGKKCTNKDVQRVLEILGRLPTVVVLGHSFVRRLNEAIQREINRMGMRPAIRGRRRTEGSVVSRLLELAHMFEAVHLRYTPTVISNPNNGPHDISNELMALQVFAPEILVLVLSSNDLANPDTDPVVLAGDIVNLAIRAQTEARVTRVVITSCLNRSAPDSLPCDFDERVSTFNEEVRSAVRSHSGISYYRIRGFSELMNGDALPTDIWSHDGIHPDPSTKYFHKFKMEVRGAILSALPRLAEFLLAGVVHSPPPKKDQFGPPPPPPPPGAAGIAAH